MFTRLVKLWINRTNRETQVFWIIRTRRLGKLKPSCKWLGSLCEVCFSLSPARRQRRLASLKLCTILKQSHPRLPFQIQSAARHLMKTAFKKWLLWASIGIMKGPREHAKTAVWQMKSRKNPKQFAIALTVKQILVTLVQPLAAPQQHGV